MENRYFCHSLLSYLNFCRVYSHKYTQKIGEENIFISHPSRKREKMWIIAHAYKRNPWTLAFILYRNNTINMYFIHNVYIRVNDIFFANFFLSLCIWWTLLPMNHQFFCRHECRINAIQHMKFLQKESDWKERKLFNRRASESGGLLMNIKNKFWALTMTVFVMHQTDWFKNKI